MPRLQYDALPSLSDVELVAAWDAVEDYSALTPFEIAIFLEMASRDLCV